MRVAKPLIFFVALLCQLGAAAATKDSLTSIVNALPADTQRVKVLNELAYLFIEEDSAKAVHYINESLLLAKKLNFKKGYIKALYNMAYLKEFHFAYQEATLYYETGIRMSQQAKNVALEGYGYQDFALLLKKQGLHQEALDINLKALALFQSIRDTNKIMVLYANIGNNYKNLGYFEKAIQYHLEALGYANDHGKYVAAARAYNNIGLIYEKIGNDEKALENYLAMVQPAERSGDKKTLTVCYGNIGATYQNLGQNEKALEFLTRARAVNEMAGYKTEALYNMTNIATCLNDLGRYKEALKISQEAISQASAINDAETVGFGHLSAAEALHKMKKYGDAERHLMSALNIARNVKNRNLEMAVEERYSLLYETTGKAKEALMHLKTLAVLKDSVYNTERHEQIAMLQTKYEAHEKDEALNRKNGEIAESLFKIKSKNRLLGITTIGAVGLILLIGLLMRNAKLKEQKMQQEGALIKAESVARLQEEKLRISRELHDNVGGQLTFINSSLQRLKPSPEDALLLKETQNLTLSTVRELRNAVWLINHQEFSLEAFGAKLHDYIRSLPTNGLKVALAIDGNVEQRLQSLTASHIFRIVQETINNALKHAHATALTVQIHAADAQLNLVSSDNGTGFDPAKKAEGYGLLNMKTRIEELGGKFEVHSIPGKGTTIRINVPLA